MTTFTQDTVRTAVASWYDLLDRHVPLEEALTRLVDEGLEMRFPEATARGHAGFADWYKAVTNRFFDEVHTVTSVEFLDFAPDRATVKVVVNWQATIWNPPAAKSRWLGFDAYQTWEVVPGELGTPLVKTYIVDALQPMPGSAAL
ncbi:nuclear transport factor 2 family protein [Actinoplanes sp. RD1]|uniref:nuclear transport factor 2 family protein n=1 Tax=Actinoplanes sp. RD1 TaxID=3064538 RepID=UPI0027405B38|nr:nuclear transport factor 2 family protein [Actinoplanes sp. RD1]